MKARIRINKDFYNPEAQEVYRARDTLTIEVSKKGIPSDKFWRRRYSDAKIDNCITVIETVVSPQKAVKNTVKTLTTNKVKPEAEVSANLTTTSKKVKTRKRR